MKLIVVRHGETIANINKICQGQTHGQLSDKGIDQAKKLGSRLKNEKIDVIYSSDLNRTIDTAKEILKYHPELELKLDKRIRERFFGELEGKPFPEEWDWSKNGKDVETNQDICLRVKEFIDDIYKKHKQKTVLVVCHGGTKMGFLTVIHNKPVSEFENWDRIKNTSVSEFIIEEDGNHKIRLINCIKHLD